MTLRVELDVPSLKAASRQIPSNSTALHSGCMEYRLDLHYYNRHLRDQIHDQKESVREN